MRILGVIGNYCIVLIEKRIFSRMIYNHNDGFVWKRAVIQSIRNEAFVEIINKYYKKGLEEKIEFSDLVFFIYKTLVYVYLPKEDIIKSLVGYKLNIDPGSTDPEPEKLEEEFQSIVGGR